MSDFGWACCEMVAAIGRELASDQISLRASDSEFQVNLVPVASLAVLANSPAATFGPSALHARHLEAAIGADDGETVGLDCDDLADLAGDAFGVLGRQRLGLEDLQRLAVERGPGAGRRIAAADQLIDLLPGLPQSMFAFRRRSGLHRWPGFVLLDARGLAGLHQIDGLHHRLDAHREQPVEIDRAERVGAD